MDKCKFNIAWVGQCKQDADETGYCQEHGLLVCRSYGKQATHTCHETFILVCGTPLCDGCEHTLCENGCNSGAPLPKGMKDHCKKGEQVYDPWYMQDERSEVSKPSDSNV